MFDFSQLILLLFTPLRGVLDSMLSLLSGILGGL